MFDVNFDCIDDLLKPAKIVLKARDSIRYDPVEKRIGLWNEISENSDRYRGGECGEPSPDVNMHVCSQFDVALLVLAMSFKENGEDFRAAERFSDKEIEAYKGIERYNVFEILSIDDILKRIVSEDDNIMNLLREYYVHVNRWVDGVLDDFSIKLTVRNYLKENWKRYKGKLDEAVSRAIVELDWFRKLISEWEKEAEKVGVVRDKIRDVLRKIEEKEEEVKVKEKEVKVKEERLERMLEELKRAKEKIEKGSRHVTLEDVKYYEMTFIGRMKDKLKSENRMELFEKTFEVKTRGGEISSNLPENACVIAEFVEKKLFGRKDVYVLKAIFVSRIERYSRQGFDTDPVELEEVNRYLVDAWNEAKDKRMVLCLASSTGFEEKVKEYIAGREFHKNFLSDRLSLILMDIETNEVHYNPHDVVAKEFVRICELETDVEKKAKVYGCVKELVIKDLTSRGYVVLEDVMVCGDRRSVKEAFYRIAEEMECRVKYIEDVGLVMLKVK